MRITDRLIIALVDGDDSFNKRFSEAMSETYGDVVGVIPFSDIKKALDAAENMTVHVILVENAIYNQATFVSDYPIGQKCIIRLTDSFSDEKRCGRVDVPLLCKYRSADEWMNLIDEYVRVNLGGGSKISEDSFISQARSISNSIKVLIFSSGSGGAGTSSVALAYAWHRSKKGIPTVYFSLEPFPSTDRLIEKDLFFNGEDLLYSIRTKRNDLKILIRQALYKKRANFYMITPGKSITSQMSITGEEIIDICRELAKLEIIKTIVLDLPFLDADKITLPFMYSDVTVLVSNGSEISNKKTSDAIHALSQLSGEAELSVLSHTFVLMNDFNESSGQAFGDNRVLVLGGIEKLTGENLSFEEKVALLSKNKVLKRIDDVLGV